MCIVELFHTTKLEVDFPFSKDFASASLAESEKSCNFGLSNYEAL